MHRRVIALGAAAALLLVCAPGVNAAPKSGGGGGGAGGGTSAGKSYTAQFRVPVKATVASSGWCDNKGPHITLDTANMFDGFATRVQFSKNKNDEWHAPEGTDTVAELTLSTGEASTSLPKQPSLGGVGGNPFIYIQPDATVEKYHYLGRCVQDGKLGLLQHGRWSVDTTALATSVFSMQALECTNKGSSLSIGTDTSADAPTGNIVLSNSDMGLNPQHIASIAGTFGFALGEGMKVKKGGGVSGVGGNPHISSDYGTVDQLGAFTATPGTFNNFGGVRCNKI